MVNSCYPGLSLKSVAKQYVWKRQKKKKKIQIYLQMLLHALKIKSVNAKMACHLDTPTTLWEHKQIEISKPG
jgi:hypothetical protein